LRDYISILNLNFPFLIQTNKDKITLQKIYTQYFSIN